MSDRVLVAKFAFTNGKREPEFAGQSFTDISPRTDKPGSTGWRSGCGKRCSTSLVSGQPDCTTSELGSTGVLLTDLIANARGFRRAAPPESTRWLPCDFAENNRDLVKRCVGEAKAKEGRVQRAALLNLSRTTFLA